MMTMLRLSFLLVLIISFLNEAEGACTVVNPTDLVFVVDNSGSICDSDPNYVYLRDKTCNNWILILNFMNNVISQIQIDPTAVMVGLVVFQTDARVVWTLDRYSTKAELTNAISNLAYVGGETATTLGITAMRTQVFTQPGDRSQAANVAIIVTDGNPNIRVNELSQEVLLAQAQGITMVAVGITSYINETILRSLSSPPQQKDYNYFMSPDFQSVDSIYRRLAIITFCPSEAPQLDETTTANPCITTPFYADICFVVDGSGSICDTDPKFLFGRDYTCDNWGSILQFMKNLVSDLTIGPNANRVAVVIFSSYAYVAWGLDRFTDKASLLNAIDQLKYEPGGDTATTDGLMKMRTEVFGQAGNRLDVFDMGIILTDGRPTIRAPALPNEISSVQVAGIAMYAIGITNSIDENTLMKLATPPPQKDVNYFMSPDFTGINVIKSRFQSQVLCPSTTPPGPISNPCVNTSSVADVCLVVDASGSVCDTDPGYVYGRDSTCQNFENLKTFMKDIVQTLNVAPNGNRVAVVIFSSYATVAWTLDRYMDVASQVNAIGQITYVAGGDTATTDGLMKMRTEVFGRAGDRPEVNNVGIVITDGRPTIRIQDLQAEIDSVIAALIRLVSIGITNSIDEMTLKRMSSPPHQKDKDYFMTSDFNSINTIKNSLATQVLCPSIATNGPILQPTTTLGIVCPTVNRTDLVFVLDNSGSICDSDPNYVYPRDKMCNNWQTILDFVRNLVIGIPVGSNAMRIGLVTFHSYATVQFTLDQYPDQASVLNAINQVQYVGGETATADGLRKMRTQVLDLSPRPNANKVGIVITDGKPNVGVSNLVNEVNLNQQAGINIVAVGITNQIDENTLKMIGSPPHQLNQNYFMSPDFANVNTIRENLIRSTFCPS